MSAKTNNLFLLAFTAALHAVEQHLGADTSEPDTSETPTTPAAGEPAKRRGRPPGAAAASTAPATPDPDALYASLQAAIRPIVEDGKGDDVKKVIAKYSSSGLKGIPADKAAAFQKDLEALSY